MIVLLYKFCVYLSWNPLPYSSSTIMSQIISAWFASLIAVYLFKKELIKYLKKRFNRVKKYITFLIESKSKPAFVNLCHHVNDFGLKAEWIHSRTLILLLSRTKCMEHARFANAVPVKGKQSIHCVLPDAENFEFAFVEDVFLSIESKRVRIIKILLYFIEIYIRTTTENNISYKNHWILIYNESIDHRYSNIHGVTL